MTPLTWDTATPGVVPNPQSVFSGSTATACSSSIIGTRQGAMFIQYETGPSTTFTSWVNARIIGTGTFFTMSLANASIGNNIQTIVTGSGLYMITPALAQNIIGGLEIKPVISSLATNTLGIMTSYTQG